MRMAVGGVCSRTWSACSSSSSSRTGRRPGALLHHQLLPAHLANSVQTAAVSQIAKLPRQNPTRAKTSASRRAASAEFALPPSLKISSEGKDRDRERFFSEGGRREFWIFP